MKQKLTLTVNKKIINRARRFSKQTGKSISRLFEEFIEQSEQKLPRSSAELSAEKLLNILNSAKPVKALDDKELLKEHLTKKYA